MPLEHYFREGAASRMNRKSEYLPEALGQFFLRGQGEECKQSVEEIRESQIISLFLMIRDFFYPGNGVKMNRTILAACLAAALIILGANPATASADTHLEEVVVTATRNEKSADEVTADVEIVSQEEIQASVADNPDDLLRQLPGVDIRRPTSLGITSPLSVNIRGVGGSKRVLMMVDGVPTNSALTGFIYPNQIQNSAIERIEVVKGAFSSLYGSNAMGGVINIITKERKEDGVDVAPSVKTGSFGLRESGIAVNGKEGKLADLSEKPGEGD